MKPDSEHGSPGRYRDLVVSTMPNDPGTGEEPVTTEAVPQRSDAFWAVPRSAQQDRYERVMRATIDLAREGGYNAVQMREVAKRSGVALGTVYTYFQSRDNL